MLKKIGFTLIIVFTLLLVVLINFHDNFLRRAFILSVLGVTTMIPLGASLIFINASDQSRNRAKKIYLTSSVLVFSIGVYSKFNNIAGAGVEIVVGVLWYCFAYAPLQLKSKYLKWKPFGRNSFEMLLLSSLDFIGINTLLLGLLFKFMYWPGAIFLMIFGAFTIFGGFIAWNYMFKKQVVKRKLAEEKIQNQYNEIKDSITYAKRLQNAILPPTKLVSNYLLESFIIYIPKDIVAGDFYFMDVIEEGHKKLVYYVAADCTGHGVPGAMVSIVGANGLKRCIQEFGLQDPGEILDKLAQIVAENFSQSEEKIRDGMDLALCCLEMENDKAIKVHYAGANNPLWVINPNRKEIPKNAIPFKQGGGFEIKANKQAIGYTENISPFDSHTIKVEEGDTLYTFSDGYPDQFGGEAGKKYKSANFKSLLLSIYDKNMDEQKEFINKEFDEWKGSLEQLDDVCIIGVRI